MPSTDEYCISTDCYETGREEFCGYCGEHWLQLEPEERELLHADYTPGPPEVIERVRTVYPAPSVASKLIGWLWRLSITATVAALAWKVWVRP